VVESGDYVGKPFTQVQAQLIALGYRVNQQQGPVASTPDANGTVSRINPTGPLPAGSEIAVFVFQDYPANAPAPSTPPTGPATGAGGATVSIAWQAYTQCPTGYPLTGYRVNLTNATFASGSSNPFAPDGSNTAQIVLSSTATSATVTYQASCGNSGLQSLPSNALTVQITP
jgi:serine/threonine-protein kinase